MRQAWADEEKAAALGVDTYEQYREWARANGYPERTAHKWKDQRHWLRKTGQEDLYNPEAHDADKVRAMAPGHIKPIFEDLKVGEEPDVERFLDMAEEIQEFMDDLDPITRHQRIRIDTDRPVAILWAGDAHLCGRFTYYPKFRYLFNAVLETPGLYWASMADDIEGFLSSFRSAEAVANQLIPEKFQRKVIASVIRRLVEADKLLFSMRSEHPAKWHLATTGDDPMKALYHSFKVPYFDGLGMLDLVVGKQTYHISLGHDLPGHSMYNELHRNTRARHFRWPNSDMIVAADKHTYAMAEFSAFRDEFMAGRRHSPFVVEIATGTAKSGPDTYTIQRWEQGIFEWPITVFWPDEFRIEKNRRLSVIKAHLAGLT